MPTQDLEAARLGDQPLYSLLVQFPAVCFVGTLLTDLAYWKTELYLWETFSVWLLAFGCVMAGVTGVVGLVSLIADRRLRLWHLAWPHALLSLAAALLSVANAFVHSRDGYTAVVPEGLILSAVVVLLMVAVAVMRRVGTVAVSRATTSIDTHASLPVSRATPVPEAVRTPISPVRSGA